MFICEHCRRDIGIDRTDDAAQILLALTTHELNDCKAPPSWGDSLPENFKPAA